MKPKLIALLAFTLAVTTATTVSCGRNKTTVDEAAPIMKVAQPIDLYFMQPCAMVIAAGTASNYCGYLPDFVAYSDDLTKLGLRGPVKYCVMGVSTISWTFEFNIGGQLTSHQFRMDSQGRYGGGHRFSYDESGLLMALGRDFRGQSPNSDDYHYSNGLLVRRENGERYRSYAWIENASGEMVPSLIENHGLSPALDMGFKQTDDGYTVVEWMTYNDPYLPGVLSAREGTSWFEYDDSGRLTRITTTYGGCRNASGYTLLYGECSYTYNVQGDIEQRHFALYDKGEDQTDRQLLYSGDCRYIYTYDEFQNWISLRVDESDPLPGSIQAMNRQIAYFTDYDLEQEELNRKEEAKNPFVGHWRYSACDEYSTPEGYNEVVWEGCELVINLYEDFIPDGFTEPMAGLLQTSSVPSMGLDQYGLFEIISHKVKGNKANITFKGLNSEDEVSATLTYNPANRSITLSDIDLSKEGGHADNPSDFEYFDLWPSEGVFRIYSKSTTMKCQE